MIKEKSFFSSIEILGTRVDMVQIPDIIRYMEAWINGNNLHHYIVVSNADSVVRSRFSSEMKRAVNNSSLSIPDGFPLVLLGRLNGHHLAQRAYGPDLTSNFLTTTENKGYTHFFYGATEDTLNKLLKNIKNRFPRLKISGFYAPPFRKLTLAEDAEVVKMINRISPSVLWVGIGCPKQEIWMYEHKDKLNVPVMVGIGAAFDYLAGTKLQAPQWIRNNGFEWLFRLITEPRRLWRRYLINNCIFLYYIAKEMISKNVYPYKKNTKELI